MALREIFSSRAFWAAENRLALIKSPVDWVLGTLNSLELEAPDPLPLSFALRQLGQDLFAPPNVKGWPGGDVWINSSTLLARKSVLERMFRSVEIAKPQMNAGKPVNSMAMAGASPGPVKAGLAPMAPMAVEREGRFAFGSAASVITFNPALFLAQYGNTPETAPTLRQRLALQEAVLVLEPSMAINIDLAGIAYLRTLVMDPVYQLK